MTEDTERAMQDAYRAWRAAGPPEAKRLAVYPLAVDGFEAGFAAGVRYGPEHGGAAEALRERSRNVHDLYDHDTFKGENIGWEHCDEVPCAGDRAVLDAAGREGP